jgi:hypothetical protein
MTIALDFPGIAYDGEPTFAGLLHRYFVELDPKRRNVGISRNWSDKTTARCRYDYERRILPALHSFCKKDMPAHELSGELFELVLQKLADEHNYSDGTVGHYRHLILLAYQAGVEHDHFSDALMWEDLFDTETATDKEKEAWRVNTMTRLRKSFSPGEEQKIVHWFLNLRPETATGEEIGLLLMFTLGLRNNEACGANFSSVRRLDYHADTAVFDMLQSTRLNSSELKSGGKTGNAPRTLLMMEPIYNFIQQRKAYLSQIVKDGRLSLPENVESVEDLPLVCKKLSFVQRAGSNDLAVAGKALFTQIGIDKSELSVLYQILCSSEVQRMQIEEKEPTTYLFRRNCATHLYQLGFAPSEIQYWMGHEIEDPFTKRTFFADPDQIYAMKEKWSRHPVLALLCNQVDSEVKRDTLPIRIEEAERVRLQLATGGESEMLVRVDVPEPQSELTLSVSCDASDMTARCQLVPRKAEYPRSASIAETVRQVYKMVKK